MPGEVGSRAARRRSRSNGGDRLAGGAALQLGQPVVLLQPAAGHAGAGGGVGPRLPGGTRLEPNLRGLLAHERPPSNSNVVIRGYPLPPPPSLDPRGTRVRTGSR